MTALTLSAVTTRGLEITLPRPSCSSAETSSCSTRDRLAFTSVSAKPLGLKPPIPVAGRFTKFDELVRLVDENPPPPVPAPVVVITVPPGPVADVVPRPLPCPYVPVLASCVG